MVENPKCLGGARRLLRGGVASSPSLSLLGTVSAVSLSLFAKLQQTKSFIISGSPTKGVRIQDGETDLEDFDLGLESELEDVKN